MPFDAAPELKPEILILDRIRELLATPDRWCKGELRSGESLCLVGAFHEANRPYPAVRGYEFGEVVVQSLIQSCPGGRIVDFNDAPTTTHADILALIDAARERIINETTL